MSAFAGLHTHGTRIPFGMCWRYLVGFPLVERAYVVSEMQSVVDPNLMPALDSYWYSAECSMRGKKGGI